MWLIADFHPVALFSIKSSLATSSGAKSLLVPTPYALKMALLDSACRLWGVSRAEAVWPAIRDLPVAARLPERAVVTNLFAKILKPRRSQPEPGSPDRGPLGRTIAFREYVWTDGELGVALEAAQDDLDDVTQLLSQINYLGKRGGFVQLLRPPCRVDLLPDRFVRLNPSDAPTRFDSRGLMQVLDDCGTEMTFEHANVYSSKRVRVGTERILHHVVLPYQLIRSSKSYTLYELLDD